MGWKRNARRPGKHIYWSSDNSEDLWWSIAYFRKGVKIYRSTCWCTPSLPKMKLPIVRLIWNFSNFRSRWHFGSCRCTPSPNQKKNFFLSKVRFELTDVPLPPPESEKNFLSEVRFELTDVPPPHPQNEKVGFQVNVTFWFWQRTSTECEKSPLSHQKMKCSFLYYVQFLMIGWVIQATNIDQNVKKVPLSHQKMKCSFLDYIQFLMISQAIQVTNVDQNVKKGPLSP